MGSYWETCVQAYFPGIRILAIDDLANRPHNCDLLIDPVRSQSNALLDYKNLVTSNCTLLSGPFYAPLSFDYSVCSSFSIVRSSLKRILIFFGGVDKLNLTSRLLSILSVPNYANISFDVVIGKSSPYISEVSSLINTLPNASLFIGLPSLSSLIIRADLAIAAAGFSSLERVTLGLPSILLIAADNQINGALELQHQAAAVILDQSSESFESELLSHVSHYLNSPTSLSDMSSACLRLSDGRGIQRIASSLIGPSTPLSLRCARSSDVYLYYRMANDPLVRTNSLSSQYISFDTHQHWFVDKLTSSSTNVPPC